MSDKNLTPEAQMKAISRRGFSWSVVAGLSAFGIWKWVNSRPLEAGTSAPLRRILDFNGDLWSRLTSPSKLVETYTTSQAKPVRTNGLVGLSSRVEEGGHFIRVEGLGAQRDIKMADLMALPRHEQVIKFKCIEGWSSVVQAAGCRFSDFIGLVSPNHEGLSNFAYLATPDEDYFVGIDTKSLMHPQTLLVWEMAGRPLKPENGAPVRLLIPIKYGIKNLKRLGLVRFQDTRPPDYWYERGYDYFAGL
ncbi:MAG: molybdopterin-dependent oxidoreductase [Chthonomonadaceae bacterium]|nr:molybdopterin-dependent oxidoreductase [Chthonomonadaceae bacterium]